MEVVSSRLKSCPTNVHVASRAVQRTTSHANGAVSVSVGFAFLDRSGNPAVFGPGQRRLSIALSVFSTLLARGRLSMKDWQVTVHEVDPTQR